MTDQLCWFKVDSNAPWLRGRFHAWGVSNERLGDYAYAQSIAIVEDVVTGRVFAVELRNITFGSRPTDDV